MSADAIPEKFAAFTRELATAHRDVSPTSVAGAFVGTGIGLLIDLGATDEQVREMLEIRLTHERDVRKPAPAPAAVTTGAKA